MITSSKMSSAPTRSHSARRPARNPGAGSTTPMFAAIGSTITAATRSSSSGTTLYGATIVEATAPAGTPAVPGRPSVATPLPPATRSASVAPWKFPAKVTITIATRRPARQANRGTRGLGARVHQPHTLATRHPLTDGLGELHLTWRRCAVRRPVADRGANSLGDRRMGVAENDRAVALDEIEVGGALDIGDRCAFGTGHDVGLASDRLERSDRGVHPTGDRPPGSLEQDMVRRHPSAGADGGCATCRDTGDGIAVGDRGVGHGTSSPDATASANQRVK